jgi:preprotein translocase SecE subunit
VNKLTESLRKLRDFLAEVRNELRKSSWPERSELFESTMVVIISVVLFSVFVGISDRVLMSLVQWVIR